MNFSDVYHAVAPWALGTNLVILYGMILLCWCLWAFWELTDDKDFAAHEIGVEDLIWGTILYGLLGSCASVIAAILWPIALPIEIIIVSVLGTKAVKEWKQWKSNKGA